MRATALTPKGSSVLIWFLKHWAGSINRIFDPIWMGLCVGHKILVYLSKKTNFMESKFIESEL